MQGVFDGPVAAVDAQQPLGIGGVRGVAGHAPGGVDRGVGDPALAHLAAGAANEEGLPDAGEQEIVVERGEWSRFRAVPSVRCAVGSLPLMGLPVVWAKSGGRFASSWNHSRMSLSRVFWLSLATNM